MSLFKKHFLPILGITLVMCTLSLTFTQADVNYEYANDLAGRGIITDASQKPIDYRLNDTLSRREMLKIMINLSDVEMLKIKTIDNWWIWVITDSWNGVSSPATEDTNTLLECESGFADISSDDWACEYAAIALKYGMIAKNEFFHPDGQVSKSEALKMILQAREKEVPESTNWQEVYVKKAFEEGYIQKIFTDLDAPAKRGFVFEVASKSLAGNTSWFASEHIKETFLSYQKPTIELAFTQNMNQKTVLGNLSLYPEIEYETNWKDEKTLQLTLLQPFERDTDVVVNISTDAQTADWEYLPETFGKKFRVDGEALVTFVGPVGQLTDSYQHITVRFSKPIVSLTHLDNQSTCPIKITPDIPGKCVWMTTSMFQFRPTQGFPAGAKYQVEIPSGIQTISGDETKNAKSFEIVTPGFRVFDASEPQMAEDPIQITFNDEINLEKLKKKLTIQWLSLSELDIAYATDDTTLLPVENRVTIVPKTWIWPYKSSFVLTIHKSMTSKRGFLELDETFTQTIQTEGFLVSARPFILKNPQSKQLFSYQNIRYSEKNDIIPEKNAYIQFQFQKEIPLDVSLFQTNVPFELSYGQKIDYTPDGQKTVDDKTIIMMKLSGDIRANMSVLVRLSRITTAKDEVQRFRVPEKKTTILGYEMIDYRNACLETSVGLWLSSPQLLKNFTFNGYWKILSYVEVDENYTRGWYWWGIGTRRVCKPRHGGKMHLLTTSLNPSTDYTLTISQDLLDANNWSLDKAYTFSFTTPVVKNIDKTLQIFDSNETHLIPEHIPVSLVITTYNLEQIRVKMCHWDIPFLETSNPDCVEKTVPVTNRWFQWSVTVIDAERFFEKTLTKPYINFKVEKLEKDKPEKLSESDPDYYRSISSNAQEWRFYRSNVAATLIGSSKNLLRLSDYTTGLPLENDVVKIETYRDSYDPNQKRYTIQERKSVNFSHKKDGVYQLEGEFSHLLITRKSGEIVWYENGYWYLRGASTFAYITSDKPLYQTGERVKISGISRVAKDGLLSPNSGNITVTITNPQYKKIAQETVALNTLWAFVFEMPLLEDTPLGTYRVSIEEGWYWPTSYEFLVAAYEKPDFSVQVSTHKDVYTFSDQILVDISAQYYAGSSLRNATGEYVLKASPYFFDGGKTNGYIFWEQSIMSMWGILSPSELMEETRDSFVLDQTGKGKFPLHLDSSTDKRYTISATVQDPHTKKSIAKNYDFIALRSAVMPWMQFDRYYYSQNATANIGIIAVDHDGTPQAHQKISYTVTYIDYSTIGDNEENGLPISTILTQKDITTLASGKTTEKLTFSQPGLYKIELTIAGYTTSHQIYIAGRGNIFPIRGESSLNIDADKILYEVWDTAQIVLHSPYTGVKALVAIGAKGDILEYRLVDITNYSTQIEIPITQAHVPSFDLHVQIIKHTAQNPSALTQLRALRAKMLPLEEILLKKEIPFSWYKIYDSGYIESRKKELAVLGELRIQERALLNDVLPEYFLGVKNILVNTEFVTLGATVDLSQKTAIPWSSQTITITLTDSDGNPVSGETTLSVMDASLLALRNTSGNIVDSLYSVGYQNSTSIKTNLRQLIKRIDFERFDTSEYASGKYRGWFENDILISDANMMNWVDEIMLDSSESLRSSSVSSSKWARASSPSVSVRTDFRDVAHYTTQVKVVDGKATVDIPKLPDNLTDWQLVWYAYTADGKVGEYGATFTVNMPIALVDQVPSFFLDGDKATLWSLVVNNSDLPQTLLVDFEISVGNIVWEKTKSITIQPGKSELVTFDVNFDLQATYPQPVLVGFTAQGENIWDALELKKTLYPSMSQEYVFTTWDTDTLSYEEKLDFSHVQNFDGQLDISVGATQLSGVTNNMNRVLTYPWDELYSRLVFIDTATKLKKIYTQIGQLNVYQNLQVKNNEGRSMSLDDVVAMIEKEMKEYITGNGALAFAKKCERECISVLASGKYLTLGLQYAWVDRQKIYNYYKNTLQERKKHGWEISLDDLWAVAAMSDEKTFEEYIKNITISDHEDRLTYIALYDMLGKKGSKTDQYLRDIKNSIFIEGRGAFLGGTNTTRGTARLVPILVKYDKENVFLIENLLRYILTHRNEEGVYYSSDFGAILDAVSTYFTIHNPKDTDFTAQIFLNGNMQQEYVFSQKNLFETIVTNIKWQEDVPTSLGFEKKGTGKLFYDIGVKYFLPASQLEAREEGIIVHRNYYDYSQYQEAYQRNCFVPLYRLYGSWEPNCTQKKLKNINPITSTKLWNMVVSEIEIVLDRPRSNIEIRDFIPAGMEIVHAQLETTSQEDRDFLGGQFFDVQEVRGNHIYFANGYMSAGMYTYRFLLKANYAGTYQVKPVHAELPATQEIWGRGRWGIFTITK